MSKSKNPRPKKKNNLGTFQKKNSKIKKPNNNSKVAFGSLQVNLIVIQKFRKWTTISNLKSY